MVGTMATLLYFGIVDYEEGNKIFLNFDFVYTHLF